MMTMRRTVLQKAAGLMSRFSSLTSALIPIFLLTTTLAMNSTSPMTAHMIRNQKPMVLVATSAKMLGGSWLNMPPAQWGGRSLFAWRSARKVRIIVITPKIQ